MIFRRWPINRITRIAAILVLMSFAVPMLLFRIVPLFFLGCLLELAGMIAVIYQAIQMWRERPGRYDLNQLRLVMEREEVEEEEAERYERNLVVCHRCGASMADFHSICPSCGAPLGE
ncbi:MAG TPA: hypothetical protein VKU00_02770 [Chthonomonadaceae bacterium]|nr:hypothetical protein [Chthonomonadaceae bacterium]